MTEEAMSKPTQRLSRRNFLLTAGATGAAAAAAIVAKNSAPAQPASGKDKRATRGYQVSEHINNYYRTTKV
jgi:nitrous oxide reductase